SSDVCSSDLGDAAASGARLARRTRAGRHRLSALPHRQEGPDPVPTRRQLLLSAAAMGTAGVGALSGCSRDGSRAAELEEGDTLRMRVWDEAAARAYESSLDAFAAASGITVEVEVISWEDYWEKLPLDMAAGTLPDVLWMNTAYLAQAHASETLLEIGELAGQDSAQWEPMATDLYRFEDGLWGVPQLWDQSLLIAHDELVEEAGVDPSDLSFDPEADTDAMREAARAATPATTISTRAAARCSASAPTSTARPSWARSSPASAAPGRTRKEASPSPPSRGSPRCSTWPISPGPTSRPTARRRPRSPRSA